MQRPNLVLILTDQERAPRPHEREALSAFRATHMSARTYLAERGISFRQHRIAASACAPSRASIFTGQSPWRHGVWHTDGFAKNAGDPRMCWLEPDRLPTIGHYFQDAGYDTAYIGKWHLSHADLLRGGQPYPTVDARGRDIDDAVAAYRQANPLAPFGFDGWVGPEPHGASPRNSGTVRDHQYARHAEAWLSERAQRDDTRPFLLVVSFVNPHDIVFYPLASLIEGVSSDVPDPGPSPSEHDDFDSRPRAQRAYRERYPQAYGPRAAIEHLYARDPAHYRRYYLKLLARVDRHIRRLVDTLQRTKLMEQTTVVLTSDHGDLLGAHGGLHQKWFNAFDETLHVPLVVSSPDHRAAAGTQIDTLTSHLDIAPTLLGLIGAEVTRDAPALVGRDMLAGGPEEPSYFLTRDAIFTGDQAYGAIGRLAPLLHKAFDLSYAPLDDSATDIEAVIARTHGRIHKLARYFDDSGQHADEWELYDLDSDPDERRNLAADPAWSDQRQALQQLLAATSARMGHG